VLFCLGAGTGQERWRMPTDLPVWGRPAAMGEYLYAGLGSGNFQESAAKPAGAVLCLERATGQRVWRYDVADGVLARVCVDAKRVYFGSRDQHCYCLDRQDGTLRWKKDLGSPILASPFRVETARGASLYAISSGGLLNRLDPDTGEAVWTFDVAKDTGQRPIVFSSPTVGVRQGRAGESRLIWFGCGLNEFTRGMLYCLEEQEKTAAQ
jgi:outer membrane protein assembly factor BamB